MWTLSKLVGVVKRQWAEFSLEGPEALLAESPVQRSQCKLVESSAPIQVE